ncbi:cysteine-rich repeat secretory protein 3-like isoform X4 [Ananas comosus]|uniref:Cysteine-rich repeat secretory protein 3-like isoform X4 n=1 Tax=Ananas comosus TaxID=4615 RepID=A0A6P5EV80_ANACO|nr:cysteine-rich repeat secretory protein 3-like isoform X4 [Ananas comosus]
MGVSEAHPSSPPPRPSSSSFSFSFSFSFSAPPLIFLLVLVPTVLSLLWPVSGADIYALVYKGCANQTLGGGGGGGSQQSVAAVASALIAQSASAKFYKATSSSGGGGVFGVFQCRGDLSPGECSSCVGRAIPMWSSLCGSAVAARIQLTGCLALYEVSGFPQVSGTQMLFKTCGSGGGGGSGFEVRRDTAFAQLQSGLSGGNGFYATSYEGVYAMAQCEGELSAGDCGECVAQAVQKSEVECGGAPSGQVYLDKCYISYSYYPNGVPRGGASPGGGGGGGGGQQTTKTVAIVVGGAAGLGFLVICLLFARSLLKKKDDF